MSMLLGSDIQRGSWRSEDLENLNLPGIDQMKIIIDLKSSKLWDHIPQPKLLDSLLNEVTNLATNYCLDSLPNWVDSLYLNY